jgi:hypothetical protein
MDILDTLDAFRSNSGNDTSFKELWVKGAALFIPQLNRLLERTDYKFEVTPIEKYNNDEAEALSNLFRMYGSDKSSAHNYHIFYAHIFNTLGINNPLNLLEIGLGTVNPGIVSSMCGVGTPGASLRAFRDYLVNSSIYGADVDKDILFEEERIKTCYVDQLDATQFQNIKDSFGDIKYDIIIDDGLHSIGANFNTLLFALDNIKLGGWIVIEDIGSVYPHDHAKNWKIIDYILKQLGYNTLMVKTRYHHLYCVQNNVPVL